MSDSSEQLAAWQSENADSDTLPVVELEPAASGNAVRASQSVAIIGGGLAGMAAAALACEQGLQVDLFEQSNRLGGRAGSMEEPWNGKTIDHCQHMAMGCCGTFLDFCRRVGVEDCFQRHRTLHFIGPDGRQSDFAGVGWLPPPFHLLPGLLRLKFLTWRECWSIVRALRKLIYLKISTENDLETFGAWLRRHGQSEKAIERFWSVALIGALSETVEFASLAAGKKVFFDGFCASRNAYELIMPRFSLGEIFDHHVPDWLERQGVRIHRSARVLEIALQEMGDLVVHLYNGTVKNYKAAIVAVPWFEAAYLFSSSPVNFPLKLDAIEQIPSAAITAVHLWFDRPITELPHATVVGRLSQWIFNGSTLGLEHAHDERGHGTDPYSSSEHAHDKRGHGASPQPNAKSYYYQVVISASHRLVKCDKEELLKAVMSDLNEIFPETRQAELLNWRVVTMPRAVFSLQPGVDRLRPSQKTAISNLFFAGDWTATGWPGTMEGAVRSGYLAAQGLIKYLG